TGNWGLPWNAVVQVIASTALVVLTVFAPLIPGLKEDFQGRLVTLAHRNANPWRSRCRPGVWAGNLWLALSPSSPTGNWGLPWNAVVQVIASTALVVLTVFAPLIPGL
ncbi:hypothetical protein CTI14_57570, partial [Methylobacterium radiotolerans]